jgi:hypothetical protein
MLSFGKPEGFQLTLLCIGSRGFHVILHEVVETSLIAIQRAICRNSHERLNRPRSVK